MIIRELSYIPNDSFYDDMYHIKIVYHNGHVQRYDTINYPNPRKYTRQELKNLKKNVNILKYTEHLNWYSFFISNN